jgi:hypothetical protein
MLSLDSRPAVGSTPARRGAARLGSGPTSQRDPAARGGPVYRNGALVRGDQRRQHHREDITPNVRTTPRHRPPVLDVPAEPEVRGEVFFLVAGFHELNEKLGEAQPLFFRPAQRAAAGSLRQGTEDYRKPAVSADRARARGARRRPGAAGMPESGEKRHQETRSIPNRTGTTGCVGGASSAPVKIVPDLMARPTSYG